MIPNGRRMLRWRKEKKQSIRKYFSLYDKCVIRTSSVKKKNYMKGFEKKKNRKFTGQRNVWYVLQKKRNWCFLFLSSFLFFLFFFFFFFFHIYVSIHVYFYLSISLSIYLSIYLSSLVLEWWRQKAIQKQTTATTSKK